MIFGPSPIDACVNCILAHALSHAAGRWRKGHVLSAADVQTLKAQGITSLVVARLEAGDVDEDAAATKLAQALGAPFIRLGEARTGRVNFYAECAGVVHINVAQVVAFNSVDESITLATLADYTPVKPGQLIATLKIIPYGVQQVHMARALLQAPTALALHPYQPMQVDLLQTTLPGMADKVHAKTQAVTRARLVPLQARLITHPILPHESTPLAQRLLDMSGDLVLIVGASAIADRADVIPQAIIQAGGLVERLGMPVDPGNLLCLGRLCDGRPVVGLPGCARSPKFNGFDMVLQRLAAGIALHASDMEAMAVGGLLDEIIERPTPRQSLPEADIELPASPPKVGVLLMAAGLSRRMGGLHKLLRPWHGVPMVRATAQSLLSQVHAGLICVVGHQAQLVAQALEGLALGCVLNPWPERGLASSLHVGIAALPESWQGVFIHLADMPCVQAATLKKLLAAFNPDQEQNIVVPTYNGQRGHPVLWGREHWSAFQTLTGDQGARALLEARSAHVVEVALDDPGILVDFDTPQDMA
jgi:molybdenum cofactor cytidylyltransferase